MGIRDAFKKILAEKKRLGKNFSGLLIKREKSCIISQDAKSLSRLSLGRREEERG
jgi:hypothetical protein